MKKVVKLKESDLVRLVNRVISEQSLPDGDEPVPKNHPINNPLWKQMKMDVEGDGVTTVKFIPNKMLVIDAFGTKYTITKG
jgi:hypothetical protein